MNYLYYVVGTILVIFIIYYLYLLFSQRIQIIDLTRVKPIFIIEQNKIKKPESNVFTFSTWIYVNNIDSDITPIITYGNNKLYIKNKIELCYDISSNDVKQTFTITRNFPLQQWIYVNISVNGMVYSFYLDGKLVKTVQAGFTSFPDIKQIILGNNVLNSVVDIHIANFKRIAKSLTHYKIALEYEKQKYVKDYYKTSKYNLALYLNKVRIASFL
jgi:hypothetical protein